jgi:hypothetical protein
MTAAMAGTAAIFIIAFFATTFVGSCGLFAIFFASRRIDGFAAKILGIIGCEPFMAAQTDALA